MLSDLELTDEIAERKDVQELGVALMNKQIPYYMWKGIILYVACGVKPGGFLCAVIDNDLMAAVGKADDNNQHLLPNYGRLLYNDFPTGSHGSKEKREAWSVARREELEHAATHQATEDMT